MSQEYKYDENTGTYIPEEEAELNEISNDDKLIAIIFWGIQFLSSTFWPLVASVVGYLYFQDKNNKFLSETAKETLNFQISYFIYAIIAIVIAVVTFGFGAIVSVPILLAYNIGIPIVGILRASEKKVYIPHFTIRFIK